MKHSRKLTQSICWCLSSLSLHLSCILRVDASKGLWEASHLWHFMLWKVVWLIIRTHLIVSAVLFTFLHQQSNINTLLFCFGWSKNCVCVCVCVFVICLCLCVWCCCGLKVELYTQPGKSSSTDTGFVFILSLAVRGRCVYRSSSFWVSFLKGFISVCSWVLLSWREFSKIIL